MKKALITGVTGQDGRFLSRFLCSKGYEVWGLIRRSSDTTAVGEIERICPSIKLRYGDLTDPSSLRRAIDAAEPDEIYNLAAQSVIEDEYLPIMMAHKIKYITFGELWKNQLDRNKQVKIQNVNGVETEIIEFSENSQVRALGYWNGMGTWFSIKQISRHKWNDKVATIRQKFGSVTVTPNHCLLDINQNRCNASDNRWLLNVRKLNYSSGLERNEIKISGIFGHVKSDGKYNWLKQGKTDRCNQGKVIKNIKEESDIINICKFIGAFVSEGHAVYNKCNDRYFVGISNSNKKWLEEIDEGIKKLFIDCNSCFVRHKKDGYDDVWELQLNSKYLYYALCHQCGKGSNNKKLPDWVFQLDKRYQQVIFDNLMFGDGCYTSNGMWRYSTSSYLLSCQLSLLSTMLGYDYTTHYELNDHGGYYHLRQCDYYSVNQGKKYKNIEYSDYNGYVYDISVEEVNNFAVGNGNIVVHNSHVRISFDVPEYTSLVNGTGVVYLLDAVKETAPHSKVYQACHDVNTKVIAEKGIVDYKSIDVGEKVYTLNIETRKMELKKVKKIHEYDFDGDMIHVNGQRTDQKVTPNHRLLLKFDNGEIKYEEAKDLINFLPYDRTSVVSLVVPTADYDSCDSYEVDLRSVVDFSKKSKNHTKNLIEKMDIEDLMYLVGIYLGDGWIKKNKKAVVNRDFEYCNRDDAGKFISVDCDKMEVEYENSYIQFAVPKSDPERKKIIMIFDKYNMDYTEGEITMSFSSFPLSNIFRECGQGFYSKHIPNWVWDHSDFGLLHLYKGLIGSDGHVREKGGRESFSTSSKKLLKDIIVLSYRLGKHCSYSERKNVSMYLEKENRFIRSTCQGYIVSFNQKQNNKIYKKTVSKVPYQGKVWCLEIEDNCNFLVSRNGKVCFSGNSTSELFGSTPPPQNEKTPFHPRSPYGVAKLQAYWAIINYRESYNIFAAQGILFNHESEYRGENFVTRKITKAASRIALGKQDCLFLGNLDARRDWGYAGDYVRAMYKILQYNKPEEFVIATGEAHSVRDFLENAFLSLGMKIKSNGKTGLEESYINTENGKEVVKIDPRFYRPAEVNCLLGDASKAENLLNWKPEVSFEQLVALMVKHDYDKEKQETQ